MGPVPADQFLQGASGFSCGDCGTVAQAHLPPGTRRDSFGVEMGEKGDVHAPVRQGAQGIAFPLRVCHGTENGSVSLSPIRNSVVDPQSQEDSGTRGGNPGPGICRGIPG